MSKKRVGQPKPTIERLLELQQFLLAFRAIKRVVHTSATADEFENDSEHSYSLAMTAWYLSPYFPELEQGEVIRMALAHDVIEVHAGDTFFYADEAVQATKTQREADAYEQIKQDWPDWPQLTKAIRTYEDRKTPESRFVYALDKIMPIMVIYLTKGRTWQQQNITLEMLEDKKYDKVALSPAVNEYYKQLVEILKDHPDYFGVKTAR